MNPGCGWLASLCCLCALLSTARDARAEVFARTDDTRPRPPEKRQRQKNFALDAASGVTYYSGNVDHYAISAKVDIMVRLAERHELFLDGSAIHSFFGGESKIDRDAGSLLYVFGFHEHWNLYIQSTHSRNRLFTLDYRTTNSLGICFHGWARPYFDTALVSLGITPENEWWSDDSTFFGVRATLRLTLAFETRQTFKIGADLIYAPVIYDPADFRLFVEVYLQARILEESLSFRLTIRDEYDSRPLAGIENNDVSIVPSLVVHSRR